MGKKSKIKKCGYPLWFNILFFCLTVAGPIILVIVEGMKANHTWFQFTFSMFCVAIVAWFFIERFVIKPMTVKLIAKQTALEHDYAIDNGTKWKIKTMWYNNEAWLALFTMVKTVLYGGLVYLILWGVDFAIMKISGALLIIGAMYVIAYTLKFMIIITSKGVDNESNGPGQTQPGG